MKDFKKKHLLLVVLASLLFMGWGKDAHLIINGRTGLSFNGEMSYFLGWVDSLAAHASDADYRKSWDPTEDIKHYIDIDNYPSFVANGYIIQDIDSLKMIHGAWFVENQGILPWAILWTMDSIKAALGRGDFHRAMLHAADLGHYVGDASMPLHITRNYNGQYTGQSGVHSRFESSMISRFKNEILFEGDSIEYIANKRDYVFSLLYENYKYVDSVLKSDSLAKAITGSTSNSAYYAAMWSYAKPFTVRLMKRASNSLAELLYTVWVDAGRPLPLTAISSELAEVKGFGLRQNYPNPFNPTTVIKYIIEMRGLVSLKIYDLSGREVSELINKEMEEGEYTEKFDGSGLSSGVYFYQLETPGKREVRKMVLIK
ncbi:MAG: T9SS type A sorting domain-containing protein [Ignavibacteriaceae bacterium]|jgi:hypothetical protein|nr:T9SS type A sorting domain-containing protein [Ignavibacteriaceae bacterium]HPO55017.1 T9SS type A sorting domain-containing protein [Ignavibacteriaceae bacterium]